MELLLLLGLVPGAAQAAYTLSPVFVEGRPALLVSTISASGTIGGTFMGKAGAQAGFTRDPAGSLTILAPDSTIGGDRKVPIPTSINDRGIVAGIESGVAGTDSFVSRMGRVVSSFGPSIRPALPGLPLLVEINHQGTVAYDTYVGSGVYSAYTGQSNAPRQIEPHCSFPYVESINKAGTVAGNCQPYGPAVFTRLQGAIRLIYGPGRTDAFGGFVNDQGAVAGTYKDKDGSLHGFVDMHGKAVTFDAPGPVSAMAVAAFSNTGIVAGTYTDPAGAFHGFAWHDGRFSELLAEPSPARKVTVAGVSDAGDVPLNLLDTRTGTSVPYVAHCKGRGC